MENINVMVIGSGGREYAICRKLKASSIVNKVFCAPGNPAMNKIGVEVLDIEENDYDKLIQAVELHQIAWTFVGGEVELANGIVDVFQEHHCKIIGPDKEAAQLESSKSFALKFMRKNNIPTAQSKTFSNKEVARKNITEFGFPLVIKKDGLAGGKGVYIAPDQEAALQFVDQQDVDAAHPLVYQECLSGQEYSVFILLDQNSYQVLPISQDHKRAYDNDEGPNTGGMGAYSPVPQLTSQQYEQIMKDVVEPTVKGVHREKFSYKGILYVGIMMTAEGPKVIEYNVRLGDPETQVVLPRIENDFAKLLNQVANNEKIDNIIISYESFINVVLAAKGYPQNPVTNQKIDLTDIPENIFIDYANVSEKDGVLYNQGGRILSVVGSAASLKEAQKEVYSFLNEHPISDTFYRKDIGNKAICD